ncbi:MAG: DUF2905 domain-containing protein [Candidatus Methylophosphatis roskildensis]|jgi:uncharacterized protein HemY|uniref:DUF2905 domain-containing protein n=1 Tax=Candidatus Methylophosphatis roskildensis TaxID=2899263 RepID=A0A9D7E294_9PROT|nr:DUF2905 domain-containing protein [Candidatus Methylophosphatis roskildensis]MBK7662841.1 DUF2905 domain-containing protein [Sterolibacteriaceae bacterium]MBK9086953.1 DUF2905 domain-containing protein [Sterolibacteriaceae bacterium]
MGKWLLTVMLTVLVVGIALPRLRMRSRLPGDVSVSYRGRRYEFPFMSVLLFSLLAWALFRLV